MNYLKISIQYYICSIALLAIAMYGCLPESKDLGLGPKPEASFTVDVVSDKVNTFLATNTTPGGFNFFWDKGNGFQEGRETDTLYFPKQGDYTVRLRVLTSGGSTITEQTVSVAEDDPDGCIGAFSYLTGCERKTWILNPGPDALWVGDPGGARWWSNSQADVGAADRACLFNNEYTFTEDGKFIFDDNGNFRVDDEGDNPWPEDIGLAIGCYSVSEWPEKYSAWLSGEHSFQLGPNALKVIGLGAHLGLYKAGQEGTISEPENENTYEIMEISEERLVIRKLYDWGQWRFTLVPKD